MMNSRSFSKPEIGQKLANRFGSEKEPIKAELKYTRQVQEFVQKIEQAHKDAAKSTLVYR